MLYGLATYYERMTGQAWPATTHMAGDRASIKRATHMASDHTHGRPSEWTARKNAAPPPPSALREGGRAPNNLEPHRKLGRHLVSRHRKLVRHLVAPIARRAAAAAVAAAAAAAREASKRASGHSRQRISLSSTLSESSLTVARDTSLNLDELVFILSPKTRETHDRG